MSDTDTKENPEPQAPPPPATSPGKPEGKEGVTFTQTDVDVIAAKTRKEGRDSGRKEILEELGIEDVSAIKALLKEYQERKQAEMSELEKAQAVIDAANKKAADVEAQYKALQQEQIAASRRDIFLNAARTGGGQKVDDLYILVNAKRGAEFNSLFDDDNKPDDGKLKAFIKQVQVDFSSYFGIAGAGSPSNSNGIAITSKEVATKEAEDELSKLF